jgi:hypothetical protein
MAGLDAVRGINDGRETVRPVMAVACETAEARAIPAHHQPIAVVLDFMNPQRAGRWSRDPRGLAWFNEAGGAAQDHLRHLYRNDLEPSANAQFNSPVALSKLMTTA